MLAIAAFGGDDVQIMQLGFANGATEYFKGPNIIEILEHDFDNSLAFRACRFTGIPIPFQHRVDGCRVSSETSALPLSALDTVERE